MGLTFTIKSASHYYETLSYLISLNLSFVVIVYMCSQSFTCILNENIKTKWSYKALFYVIIWKLSFHFKKVFTLNLISLLTHNQLTYSTVLHSENLV